MGCRAQPVRYPISRTVQKMTRETRMGQPSYTEFRILPSGLFKLGMILKSKLSKLFVLGNFAALIRRSIIRRSRSISSISQA